jgi:hypothetical protein
MPNPRARTPQSGIDDEQNMWESLSEPDQPTIRALDEFDSRNGSLASSMEPPAPVELIMKFLLDAGISEGRALLMVEDEDTMDLIQALFGRLGYLPALITFLRGSEDELAAAANKYATSTPLEDIIEANIVYPVPATRCDPPSCNEVNPFGVHATQETSPPQTPAAQLKDKGKSVADSLPFSPPSMHIQFTQKFATTNPAQKKLQKAAMRQDELRKLEALKIKFEEKLRLLEGTTQEKTERRDMGMKSTEKGITEKKGGKREKIADETSQPELKDAKKDKNQASEATALGESSKKRRLGDDDTGESGTKRPRIPLTTQVYF